MSAPVEHDVECWAYGTDDMTMCDCVPGFLTRLYRRPESRDELDDLVTAFYGLDGNIVGGTLHVVLDDQNWERHHIERCRSNAHGQGDVAGERLAELLLTMTDEQLKEWLGPRYPETES